MYDASQQYTEEGYDVLHIPYPPIAEESFAEELEVMNEAMPTHCKSSTWGLITYGISGEHIASVVHAFAVSKLKAIAHYCPIVSNAAPLLFQAQPGEMHISFVFSSKYSFPRLTLSAVPCFTSPVLKTLSPPPS